MKKNAALFFCAITAIACGCQLPAPPTYSSECKNFTYIDKCYRANINNLPPDDPCIQISKYFEQYTNCPNEYPYCIENAETGGGCVNTCPNNYHAKQEESADGSTRYICEEDSITACGSTTNNCTNLTGWDKGVCHNAQCIISECREPWALDDESNSCLTQNQKCGELHLNCENVPMSSLNQDIIDQAKQNGLEQNGDYINLKCVVSTDKPNGECSPGCEKNQVFCDGFCVYSDSNKSYCGAVQVDSKGTCEHAVTCKTNQNCVDGKCECVAGMDKCGEDEDCYNLQSDLTNCGECGNNCAQQDGWIAGSCVDGKCVANDCGPGYHKSKETGICVHDTEVNCGPNEINCEMLENWEKTTCVHGKCVAESCSGGLVLSNGECGDKCGGRTCVPSEVANSDLVSCENNQTCIPTMCKTNYTLIGKKCCKDVDHEKGEVTLNPNGECSFNCFDEYVNNGIKCCDRIEHAIFTKNSQTCEFECQEGFTKDEENRTCYSNECVEDDTRCSDKHGIGYTQDCIHHKWGEEKICPNSFSCNADEKTCGKCQNGNKTCSNNGSIGNLSTCTKGQWTTKRCTKNNLDVSCDGNSCGECLNDSTTCINDKNDMYGVLSICANGRLQMRPCYNSSCNQDNTTCGECINRTQVCVPQVNQTNARLQLCTKGELSFMPDTVQTTIENGHYVCIDDCHPQLICDEGYELSEENTCVKPTPQINCSSIKEDGLHYRQINLPDGKAVCAYPINHENFPRFVISINNKRPFPSGHNRNNAYFLAEDIKWNTIRWTDTTPLPIGSLDSPFEGIFDGNHKTISDIVINTENNTDRGNGLFGYVNGSDDENRAMIYDLTLSRITINDNSHDSNIGGLAGFINNAFIQNIYINGITINLFDTNNNQAGGLIGHSISSTIKNATVNVMRVNVDKDNQIRDSRIGGLVGLVQNGTLENTLVNGVSYEFSPDYISPIQASQLGGFAGVIFKSTIANSEANTIISIVENDTLLKLSSCHFGGFAGHSDESYYLHSKSKFDALTLNYKKPEAGINLFGGFLGESHHDIFELCAVDKVNKSSLSKGHILIDNSVPTDKPEDIIGGFVGMSQDSSYEQCASLENIHANNINVGGFIGYIENNEEDSMIHACVSAGSILTEHKPDYSYYTGGFIGSTGNTHKAIHFNFSYSARNILTQRTHPSVFGEFVGSAKEPSMLKLETPFLSIVPMHKDYAYIYEMIGDLPGIYMEMLIQIDYLAADNIFRLHQMNDLFILDPNLMTQAICMFDMNEEQFSLLGNAPIGLWLPTEIMNYNPGKNLQTLLAGTCLPLSSACLKIELDEDGNVIKTYSSME